MAQKRFGPTLDAGTVIIEKESEKTIQPSQLGSTAYVGILERGPIGELITTVGKKDMLAKTGGLIPDSLLPDCCQDFWDHSGGAGVLFLYRVTDGSELKASAVLWDRNWPRNQVVKIEEKYGGAAGGRRDTHVVDLSVVPGDITSEITIDLPIAFHPIYADQFKGGTLTCSETGKSYSITGNDASDGAAKTELRLTANSKLLTDFGAGTDPEFAIEVTQADEWGRDRKISYEILDGQIKPSTEWGLKVYLNDELVKTYPDMSSDPNDANYFVNVVNDDTSNYYVGLTDLWVGSVDADNRPANFYAEVDASDIDTKQITLDEYLFEQTQSGTGGPHTLDTFTLGTKIVKDRYSFDFTAAWALTSLDKQATHVFPAVVSATPFTPDNAWSFGATLTESGPISGDQILLWILALVADEAINGRIFFPEESWAPGQGWFVTDNEEGTVSITSGDMTNGGTIAGTIKVRLQYQQELEYGYAGIAEVDESDFVPAFDVNTSPFNNTVDEGYGLIKFACPGVTELSGVSDVVVEKAGVAYCEAKNHQYRYEIPSNVTDEISARDYVNNTLGRSDHAKVCMHGFVKVSDPVLSGNNRLKTIPSTGMIHGREARVARAYDGYHKVAAGVDVTFPRIRQLLTGETKLNGEIINPAGLQRIEKKAGNFVLWGARIPSVDPAFKFSQHRELLSYYEHVLAESFDWVIFAINDELEQPGLVTALQTFFEPEWIKRALRGDTLEEAAAIKLDGENNTDATRAAGDMNAEIALRMADTIERFIITIGKAGIFESVAA